jgi:hypothetical protein
VLQIEVAFDVGYPESKFCEPGPTAASPPPVFQPGFAGAGENVWFGPSSQPAAPAATAKIARARHNFLISSSESAPRLADATPRLERGL